MWELGNLMRAKGISGEGGEISWGNRGMGNLQGYEY